MATNQSKIRLRRDCFRARSLLLVSGTVVLFLTGSVDARAQLDGRKTEVGVQFSLFRQSDRSFGFQGVILPVVTPYLSTVPVSGISGLPSSAQDAGFGGRVGYNFSDYIAAEGEVNFFPTRRQSSGGRKTEAVFGLKAGGRVDDFGLFAKVRPGLMHFSDSPEGGSDTNFALDVGAVVEYYPSRRTLIRVDLSDVIVHFEERTFSPFLGGFVFSDLPGFLQPQPTPPQAPISLTFRRPSLTTHNFQFSVGFGLRF